MDAGYRTGAEIQPKAGPDNACSVQTPEAELYPICRRKEKKADKNPIMCEKNYRIMINNYR